MFQKRKEFGCCDVNIGDVIIVRSDPANLGTYIYVYGRVIDTKCGGEIVQVGFDHIFKLFLSPVAHP